MVAKVTPEQTEVILHPDRMRIVGEFIFGDALTAHALHERLPELATATLYRHLALLTESGVLAVRDTHARRGATEKTYALAVSLQLSPDEIAKRPGRFMPLVISAAAALLRVFSRYLERTNLSKRKVDPRLRFYAIEASDEEYRSISNQIDRMLSDAAKHPGLPSKTRRRRMFFLAAVPEFE
jgi:hypothetical protein